MFRIINVIIIMLALAANVSAQEPGSYRYYDSLTYNMYLEKNWNELIKTGNSALKAGHDYYYLRMRLGIAFFEKSDFSNAARHFRKAQEFSLNDQVASEYLFYCRFLSDRPFQAWSELQGTFDETKKRILGESNFKKNNITAESFYSNFLTNDLLNNPDEIFGNTPAGSQSISRSLLNTAFYAYHIMGKNFAYYHSFSNLLRDNFLFYSDGVSGYYAPDQRVIQNQYYGAFNFFSNKGWLFTPAFNLIFTSYPYFYTSGHGMNAHVTTTNTNDFNYVASLRVSRAGEFLRVTTDATFSRLNYLNQVQGNISMVAYPLGNSKLYLGGSFSTIYGLNSDAQDFPLIFGATFGFSIKSKVWFDLSATDGYTFNYIDGNGLIVYNGADVMTRKISGKILIPAGKSGLTFFFGAGRSWYLSEWVDDAGNNSGYSNNIEYISNNLTGGVSWNF